MGYLVISIAVFQDVFDTAVDEDNLEYSENGRWPFQQFVDQLIHDMFDPSKLAHLIPEYALYLTVFCCLAHNGFTCVAL